MDLVNLIDEETSNPLDLDATSFTQMQSLTRWHLNLAQEYPQSFYHVLLVTDVMGIADDLSELSYRAFNDTAANFTPLERKLLIQELTTLSYMPVAQPLGCIVTTNDDDNGNIDSVEKAHLAHERAVERQKILLAEEAPLIEHIETSIDSLLSDRQKHVVTLRLGLDGGQPKTLENVGESLGVTRERIRQIEVKALSKVERVALWDDVFRDTMATIVQEHGPLLETSFLSNANIWFEGFELNREGWRLFLKFFAPGYAVQTIDDRDFLIAADGGDAAVALAKKMKSFARRLTPALFEVKIQEEIEKAGIQQSYFRALCISLGEVEGHNVRAIARQFIDEATEPFAIEDFIEFAIKNNVQIRDHRYIENYFGENSIVVDRRPTRYLAPHRLGLTQTVIDAICNQFYQYWLDNFLPERIFQANEVKGWLSKRGLVFKENMTDWWAVAPLKADSLSRFSHNKLRITLSEAWSEGTKPPSLSSLIEEILRVAGEPLPLSEIKSRLYPTAGWPTSGQIHESGAIRRVGQGVFALREAN